MSGRIMRCWEGGNVAECGTLERIELRVLSRLAQTAASLPPVFMIGGVGAARHRRLHPASGHGAWAVDELSGPGPPCVGGAGFMAGPGSERGECRECDDRGPDWLPFAPEEGRHRGLERTHRPRCREDLLSLAGGARKADRRSR